MCGAPGPPGGVPVVVQAPSALKRQPGVIQYLVRHEVLQGCVGGEAEMLLDARHLVLPEPAGVRGGCAAMGLRRCTDHGAQRHEDGTAGVVPGPGEGLLDGDGIGSVEDVEDEPAVGGEAGADVFAEGLGRGSVDGDAVLIPDEHQVVEREGAGKAGGLVADSLLEAAVASDRVDRVTEQSWSVGAEECLLPLRRDGHADGARESLAERPGGHLDSRRDVDLRMAGRAGVETTARGEVVEFQAVAGQIQLHVQQEACVTRREHQPVAAGPAGIGRIVGKDPLVEHMRQRSQRHRRARVAVALCLDHVGGDGDRSRDGPAVVDGELGGLGTHRRSPMRGRDDREGVVSCEATGGYLSLIVAG